MAEPKTIITVGICPAWDVTCRVDGFVWGEHQKIDSQTLTCAGKAMNISSALAWMDIPSIAAGLWGQADFQQMLAAVEPLKPRVEIRLTAAPGTTRHNITLIDTRSGQESHLRAPDTLANAASLRSLADDLDTLVRPGSIVALAGSLPQGALLDECLSIVAGLRSRGAYIVLDTSGPALKKAVRQGGLELIKPNLDELRELLDESIPDTEPDIMEAARTLCRQVRIVLVSRGARGAIAVTQDKACSGRIVNPPARVVNTVGCGDTLLAGFLAESAQGSDLGPALQTALKAASARAFGLLQTAPWPAARDSLQVEITEL